MFEDERSKRVVLIAHCILNQNAKIDRCAYYRGIIREVAHVLVDAGVGVIQMPCPELFCLGLDRQVASGTPTTIESEDTRVAGRMAEDRSQALCREMVNDLVYQIEEYRKNGFEIVGVVGINGSPACGIETRWSHGREEEGAGIFVRMLAEECGRRGISLAMRGIKAAEPQEATAAARELCGIAPNRRQTRKTHRQTG